LLLLLSPRLALATIFTWNVAAGGLTNTSVNWSPSAVPGANDDTRYWQSGVTYTITMASPADTCNSVWASSTGHPQFSCSDALRVHNAFQVDGGTTASVISGMARAGWFTVGPATLTITGNGTQAIATNNSAISYFGNSSGFTSTVNISGGATFAGAQIQVPQINGATGILNVSGHPTGGSASALHATTNLIIGNQGVGDTELSAGARILCDGDLIIGPYATGKLHLFRGFGPLVTPPTLTVAGNTVIGGNYPQSSPGGQGTLAVDQGTVDFVGPVLMGDHDGGGPDTLRMNGGSVLAEDGLYGLDGFNSLLDLHAGTLRSNGDDGDFYNPGHFIQLEQPVPLSITGPGAGPTVIVHGGSSNSVSTSTPLSLVLGRDGGGTLSAIAGGLGFSGDAVVADMSTGTGFMSADSGSGIAVYGSLSVGPGNGVVQVRHGSYVYTDFGWMNFLGGASTAGSALVEDSLSSLYSQSGAAIGGTRDTASPGAATVRVDSLGSFYVDPVSYGYLRIWGGGSLLWVSNGGAAYADSALCSGEVRLANGTLAEVHGTAAFHLMNGGVLHGTGTVRTAVALDDTSAKLEILASDPPNDTLAVGDSLRSNSFQNLGTVRVETDTLALMGKGGVDLGHVVLAGGTLRLPNGGHVRAGDVLEGNGRLEGSLIDDGLVNASGVEMDVAGHLTVLAGDIGGNGVSVLAGGELSARGHVSGLLNLAGQFDMGASLASLTMTRAPILQPTNVLTMRIGSAAQGAQDTLVNNQAMGLAGTLDLRTWKADPSLPGDTLTLITAPTVTGTFSKVTIDGVDAPSYVQVIYEPTRVRVAVLQSTVDVPSPPPGHTNPISLRFAAAGTMRSPEFALDLPRTATVLLDVYNVAGRRMAELVNGKLDAGRYRFPFQGAPGVYYAMASIIDPTGRRALTAHVVQLP
jgi:hypothetical protein